MSFGDNVGYWFGIHLGILFMKGTYCIFFCEANEEAPNNGVAFLFCEVPFLHQFVKRAYPAYHNSLQLDSENTKLAVTKSNQFHQCLVFGINSLMALIVYCVLCHKAETQGVCAWENFNMGVGPVKQQDYDFDQFAYFWWGWFYYVVGTFVAQGIETFFFFQEKGTEVQLFGEFSVVAGSATETAINSFLAFIPQTFSALFPEADDYSEIYNPGCSTCSLRPAVDCVKGLKTVYDSDSFFPFKIMAMALFAPFIYQFYKWCRTDQKDQSAVEDTRQQVKEARTVAAGAMGLGFIVTLFARFIRLMLDFWGSVFFFADVDFSLDDNYRITLLTFTCLFYSKWLSRLVYKHSTTLSMEPAPITEQDENAVVAVEEGKSGAAAHVRDRLEDDIVEAVVKYKPTKDGLQEEGPRETGRESSEAEEEEEPRSEEEEPEEEEPEEEESEEEESEEAASSVRLFRVNGRGYASLRSCSARST